MKLSITGNDNTATTPKPARKEAPANDATRAIDVEATVDEETEDEAPAAEEAPKKKKRTARKTSTAVAKRESTLPAVKFEEAGFEGDFGTEDQDIPYLKLLQPGSDAIEDIGSDFIGHFIYDGTNSFGESLTAVVCGMRKKYEEVQEEDDEALPKVFDSKEQALSQGYEVKPIAYINLAIAVDADSEDADVASFEVDGKAYVLATYSVRGRAYKAARTIFSAFKRLRDEHLCYHYYSFTSRIKPARGKKFRVPVVSVGDETPQEVRQTIMEGMA